MHCKWEGLDLVNDPFGKKIIFFRKYARQCIFFKCAENHIVGANSTVFTLLSPSVDYIKAVFI